MQKYKEPILYLVIILILFIVGIAKIQPMVVNSYKIAKDTQTKSAEFVESQRKLDTLKKEQEEKIATQGQAKKIYKPDETGLEAEAASAVLFDDIIEMAKYNQVKIYSVAYVYNPPEDEFVKGAANSYNVCQLNMQLIADYADLQAFLEELYKYPYFVNLSKLEMAPYTKDKRILLVNMQLKLYAAK